ncbi:hypothetical protein oki131_04600 [Helicobacter pylori]|nr:hypothetical protein HPOKI128_06730 [Helicobacter pylori oki128]
MRAKLSPNISLGNPIVFSDWVLHEPTQARLFENQMALGFQIPKLGSVFLSHKLTTFLKANAILNQTTA